MTKATTDAPAPPRRGRRLTWRALRGIAALFVIVLLGLWYLLETDAAGERLRRILESTATDVLGSPVTIARLDLDLLPFRLQLTDVLAQGTEAPLAQLDSLILEISPWGLLQRRIVISYLELDRPRLFLATPFPDTGAARGALTPALRVDLRRVRVRGGELAFAHRTTRIDGELLGITLQLAPESEGLLVDPRTATSGQLRVADGHIDLTERNQRQALLAPFDVDAVFALRSRRLDLDRFRVSVGTSTIAGSGTFRGFLNADLSLDADLAVDDIFKAWVPPGPGDHAGRAHFLGRLELRDGAPILTGRLNARDARMSGVPIESLACDFRLHRQEVALRNVRGRLYGGRLDGDFVVDRSVQPGRIQIDYDADDLDAARLTHWQVLTGWRLSGAVSGKGSIAWSAPFRETVSGSGRVSVSLPDSGPVAHLQPRPEAPQSEAGGSTHRAPALPLPLEASFSYRLAEGTLAIEGASFQIPNSTLSINGRADLDGTLLLGARLESDDLRMFDHLVAQYRESRSGLREPRWGLRGSGEGEFRIGGTVSAPVVSGSLLANGFGVRDLEIGGLAATVTTSGDGSLVARPLRIQRGGTATGSARVRIPTRDYVALPDDPAYSLQLNLDAYVLEAGIEATGRQRRLSAALDGTMAMQGDFGSLPTAQFDLSATRSKIDAKAFGGELRASGRWSPGDGRVVIDGTARGIDLGTLSEGLELGQPLHGQLAIDADLSGLVGELTGELAATWNQARVGSLPLGSVAVRSRAEAGTFAALALGALDAALPEIPPLPRTTELDAAPALLPAPAAGWSAAMTVSLQRSAPFAVHLRSEAAIALALMAQIGRELPSTVSLSGQLDLSVSGTMDEIASWRGRGEIAAFRLQQDEFLVTAERFEASLADGQARVDVALETGNDRLTLQSTIDLTSGALGGRVDGSIGLRALRLWRDDLAVSGTVRTSSRLSGTISAPRVYGDLSGESLALDAGWMYPFSDAVATIALDGADARIQRLDGLIAGSPFRASGTLPLAALARGNGPGPGFDIQVTVDTMPLGPLLSRAAAISHLVNAGAISATVSLQGKGRDWRQYSGSVLVAELELTMRDYRLALDHAIRAPIADGAVIVPSDMELTGGQTALRVGGRVDFAPLQIDLQTNGTLGFEPLNVLSPYWGTGGTAQIDLRVFGQAPDLAYRGTATLRDAVLSPPPLRQPVEDIRASLVFEDRRIRIDDLEGELGGGKVTASGELFLRDSQPQSFRIAATVSNALLRIEREVRVEVAADLVYDGTPDRSLISGEVRLIEGLYRRELQADDAILEMLEAPETEPDPLLAAIDLDIQVQGLDDLFVDNNLADVEVTADFDLRGTLARPVILGRSRILGGRLFWNGNTFEVLQGTVEFNNPFETEPVFEIRSRTEIRRYTIDLDFSGSLRRGVAFNYTSTPPLSDLDLFNLLAFGEDPSSSVLQDPYSYQRALGLQATRYLADAYLTEVERGAERIFGIDRFRIAPTLSGSEADATARMTLGKRINRNLYVTYSRLLSTSEDQLLTVEYQLSPEIRLKGTRDEDGSFGLDFLIQKRIR